MITPKKIQKMKFEGHKIAALTAYDCPTARYADNSGLDIILVGDSASQVVMGYDSTTKIGMEEMKVFARAVINGVKNALVVVDMPFLSYQTNISDAILNCGEFIKMGAGAVKIEGANEYIISLIKRLTDSGIPVMGHLGFTPQYIKTIGGNFIQGKSLENTLNILEDAKKIQESGAFAIVLELVPDICAEYISKNLEIPVIGIGAGKNTDGQILVINDIIGKFDEFSPKFARKYSNAKTIIENAVENYVKDVKNGDFPNSAESFHLDEAEREKFENYTQKSGIKSFN
ncbi:MAG: 3-methyl-2-oxobutanoate hydroxymethyltransferase [Candidatus Gastranaerophilales bacterium]|nr:3-methyl-2-oxobutanoate hydroxymethyltransferase [Candidatus Gastranaerophilales bacterium]